MDDSQVHLPIPHRLAVDEFGLIFKDDGSFVVLTKHQNRPFLDEHMAILAAAVRASHEEEYAQDALDWWGLFVSIPAGQA